jgi:hypothetical protein
MSCIDCMGSGYVSQTSHRACLLTIQLDNVQDVRVPGGIWYVTRLANRLMKYTRRMYIIVRFQLALLVLS